MLKRQTPRSTAFLCLTQKKSSFDGVSTPSKVNKKRSKKNTELRHVSVHNAYHEAVYRQHEQLLYTILKH